MSRPGGQGSDSVLDDHVVRLRSDTLVVDTRALAERFGRQVSGRYQAVAAICPNQTPFTARTGPSTAAGAPQRNPRSKLLNRAAGPWPLRVNAPQRSDLGVDAG